MNPRGQGAIEYLLIIGAAVIIAVIVITLMMSITGEGTGAADDAGIDETFVKAQCQKDSNFCGTDAFQTPEQEERCGTDNICSDYIE